MATILTINRSTPNDGLGDTLYVEAGKINDNFTELNDKKVEVVAGKGLSTNDYTTAEQTKLAGIAAGAEVNVQADWNQADPGQDDYIKNKPAIPSAVILVMDGKAGTTAGFIAGQTTFVLPTSQAVAVSVHVNNAHYSPTTANNVSRLNRWSQTGNVVTIYTALTLNQYIEIAYQ